MPGPCCHHYKTSGVPLAPPVRQIERVRDGSGPCQRACRAAALAACLVSRTFSSDSWSTTSATDRNDPSSPYGALACCHPGGRTPSCLPRSAVKMAALAGPKPGSASSRSAPPPPSSRWSRGRRCRPRSARPRHRPAPGSGWPSTAGSGGRRAGGHRWRQTRRDPRSRWRPAAAGSARAVRRARPGRGRRAPWASAGPGASRQEREGILAEEVVRVVVKREAHRGHHVVQRPAGRESPRRGRG